jgi:heat shock protein HslJ
MLLATRGPLAFLALAALSACASTGAAPVSPRSTAPGRLAGRLDGTAWTLAALPGRSVLSRVAVSLSFDAAGRVGGSDGCNRYGGTYRADGSALTITPGGATMMACPEPVMRQAGAFTAALTATRAYALDAGRLVLRDGAGASLATFETMQPAALPGTRWTAIAVNNGAQAVASVAAETEITAEFGPDGALSGSAGCNRYTTRYTLDGETIAIRPPALTRRACPAPVMQQEQQYTAALERAATYRLDADRLELRSAAGSLEVTYRRVPHGR